LSAGLHFQSNEIEWKWWSAYSTDGDILNPQVEALWAAIEGDHGIVAVSHEWAAERGLPKALDWPADTSKGFYLVEAYHQIHCVVSIQDYLPPLSRFG